MHIKTTTLLTIIALALASCSLSGGNSSEKTTLSSQKDDRVSKPLIAIASGSVAMIDYRLYSSGVIVQEKLWIQIHIGKEEQLGSYNKLPELDRQLFGMKSWDKKSVLLDPSVAYGTAEQEDIVRRSQITRSDASGMEEWFDPDKIATWATTTWNNQKYTIKQILDDEFVVLSHPRQHPLAGKSLTLEVEVKSVE